MSDPCRLTTGWLKPLCVRLITPLHAAVLLTWCRRVRSVERGGFKTTQSVCRLGISSEKTAMLCLRSVKPAEANAESPEQAPSKVLMRQA